MSYKIKNIFFYGVVLALLLLLLKWMQWQYMMQDHSVEVFVGLIALLFTILGIWLSRQVTKPKIEKVIVEKQVLVPAEPIGINEAALREFDLSSREYEVLQLLCEGNSNAEIADKLFISMSTVKTHASNLFIKLDVKSRAKALDKAKRLRLVL